MRPIDADAIPYIEVPVCEGDEEVDAIRFIYETDIADMPTIEPVKGKWRKIPLASIMYKHVGVVFQCTECNGQYESNTPYCPHCGAKMEGIYNGSGWGEKC